MLAQSLGGRTRQTEDHGHVNLGARSQAFLKGWPDPLLNPRGVDKMSFLLGKRAKRKVARDLKTVNFQRMETCHPTEGEEGALVHGDSSGSPGPRTHRLHRPRTG